MVSPTVSVARYQNFSDRLLPRSHKAVARATNRHIMWFHHREHMPKHFERGAGTRYGYARRTSTVSARRIDAAIKKQLTILKAGRNKGRVFYKDLKAALGLAPLVFTGETRSMVLAPALTQVRATSNRGRLVMKSPEYVASRFRKANPNQRVKQAQQEALKRSAELEAITSGEISALLAEFRREYVDIMQNAANPNHHLAVFRQRRRRQRGS